MLFLLISFLIVACHAQTYQLVGTGSCTNADNEQYPRVIYLGFPTTADCADWCYNVKETSIGFSTLMTYCQCVYQFNASIYPNHTESSWEPKFYAHNNYGRASGPITGVDPSTAFSCYKYDSLKAVTIPDDIAVYKGEGTCDDANLEGYDKAAYTGISEVVACQTLCYSKVTSIGFEVDETNNVCYCLFDENDQVFPTDGDPGLSVTTNIGSGYVDFYTVKSGTFCYAFSGNITTVGPTASPSKSPSDSPIAIPTSAPTTGIPSTTPTSNPTTTTIPSSSPTQATTTITPSSAPTTKSPTNAPTTKSPTNAPTLEPTRSPLAPGQTHAPSTAPTRSPLAPGQTHAPTLPPVGNAPGTTNTPTGAPTEKETNTVAIVSGSIIGALALLASCVVLGICWRRKKNDKKGNYENVAAKAKYSLNF